MNTGIYSICATFMFSNELYVEWPTKVCALIKYSGTKLIFKQNRSELPEENVSMCCLELKMCWALYESLLNWLNLGGFLREGKFFPAIIYFTHFIDITSTTFYHFGGSFVLQSSFKKMISKSSTQLNHHCSNIKFTCNVKIKRKKNASGFNPAVTENGTQLVTSL